MHLGSNDRLFIIAVLLRQYCRSLYPPSRQSLFVILPRDVDSIKKIKSNLFFFSSISSRSLPPFRIECHASLYSSHLIVLSECNLASLGKEITIIVLPLSESKKTLEFKGPSEIGKKKKKKLVLKGLCTALVA